jgi:hypothetical protein
MIAQLLQWQSCLRIYYLLHWWEGILSQNLADVLHKLGFGMEPG